MWRDNELLWRPASKTEQTKAIRLGETMTTPDWITETVSRHKKGSLHRILGVPPKEKIPYTLLEKIRNTPIGTTIDNPVQSGKDKIKVTKLVKQRAVWGLNLKRITQRKANKVNEPKKFWL